MKIKQHETTTTDDGINDILKDMIWYTPFDLTHHHLIMLLFFSSSKMSSFRIIYTVHSLRQVLSQSILFPVTFKLKWNLYYKIFILLFLNVCRTRRLQNIHHISSMMLMTMRMTRRTTQKAHMSIPIFSASKGTHESETILVWFY